MTPEQQIQFLMEQNAKLMEQNQQLIALASKGVAPEVPPPPPAAKLTKKQKSAVVQMQYHATLIAKMNPVFMALHKAILKEKGLWID